MKRGNLIFTVALLGGSLLLLKATLAYSFKAKIFPLITLLIILILLMIQIVREVSLVFREKGAAEEGGTGRFRTKHLTSWGWMVGTMFMFWVLGFMGTVVFLPFLYFRFQRESWLVSITLPIGCGLFFYCLFGLGLKMPLYPGIFPSKLFG
jgi:hypothetical protein